MQQKTTIGIGAVLVAVLVVSVVGVYYFTDSLSSDGPIVIVDYAGRTVTIDGPVDSVATSYPIATEVMLFIGGEDKIIGADSTTISNEFMCTLYPSLTSMTNLGRDPSLEQVVALAPDVYILGGSSTETADQLTELGIPTICLSYETPEDFNYALEVFGIIFDDEKEINKIIDYYTDQVEDISEMTKDIDDSEKPSVLFITFGSRGTTDLKTPGEGALQNNLIELAGGISVSATQPSGTINMEQVALWNPDIIIITSYSTTVSSTDLKNQILEDDTWNVTDAKKNGNVYAFAKDWESWDAPTPKWILGLYWLGSYIHPTLFDSMSVEAFASDFYEEFYGLSYEDAGVTGDCK